MKTKAAQWKKSATIAAKRDAVGKPTVRNTLQHILQAFTEIMSISQAGAFIHHYVDLDVEFVTRMIRLQALNLLNSFGEAHGQVQ